MSEDKKPVWEGWAILELMGHRRLGGYVAPAEIAGSAFLRIDVPGPIGEQSPPEATQFYSSGAIYCLTPVTEAMARAVAAGNQPQPVQRWELPPAKSPVKDDVPFASAGSVVDDEPDFDDDVDLDREMDRRE